MDEEYYERHPVVLVQCTYDQYVELQDQGMVPQTSSENAEIKTDSQSVLDKNQQRRDTK